MTPTTSKAIMTSVVALIILRLVGEKTYAVKHAAQAKKLARHRTMRGWEKVNIAEDI